MNNFQTIPDGDKIAYPKSINFDFQAKHRPLRKFLYRNRVKNAFLGFCFGTIGIGYTAKLSWEKRFAPIRFTRIGLSTE